jgi:serine/threonine protein kinase
MKPGPAMVDAALRERYRVVETLTEGADDTLFLCRRLDTDALVELRVLSGQLGADRFLVPAFRQQATVVTRISSQCPGIAKVYECERAANGDLVLVMEHPDGPTLREELRREGTLSLGRALDLAIRIAQELERAHNVGMMHGALRPENVVLVNGGAAVVLTHFGFDWLLRSRPGGAGSGISTGSERSAYQAPEQAGGEAVQQSDVHALGAILYEMLAGTPPATSEALGHSNPEPLAKRRPEVVSASLERIISRTLDAQPARRPDISELCNTLWGEAGPKEPPPTSPRRRSFAGPRFGTRTKRLVALGGLAAIGVIAIWLGNGRMTSVRPPAPKPPAQPAAIPDTPAAIAPVTATTPASVNGPGEPSPDRRADTRGSVSPAPTRSPSISLPVSATERAGTEPSRSVGDTAPQLPSPPAIPAPASPKHAAPTPIVRSRDRAESGELAARRGKAASPQLPSAPAQTPAASTRDTPTAPAPSPPPRDSAEDPGAIIDWLIQRR